VFGKPANEKEAVRMLAALSGRTHQVLTAVALCNGGLDVDGHAVLVGTEVTFYPCTRAELKAYVATGESLDKAGAYAAQGFGALLIDCIEGCYFNVVGLPLATTARMLKRAGFDLWVSAEV
jgi:septum formation protein